MEGACQGGDHHARLSHGGGLKIRKWPSSKCNTAAGSNFRQKHLFESFLEYGSYIRQEKKIGGLAVMKQPLIFHTVDPEIVLAEPGEFTSVVQRLTGSRQTRMAIRDIKRKQKGWRAMQSVKNTQKCVLAATSPISGHRLLPLPLLPPPPSTADSLIELSDTDVHPSSPSRPAMPSAAPYVPAAVPSPTSCSEGYHTDISTESCDSLEPSIPARWAPPPSNSCHALAVGSFMNEEELVEGSSFFLFSLDSYYGNQHLEFNPASHATF